MLVTVIAPYLNLEWRANLSCKKSNQHLKGVPVLRRSKSKVIVSAICAGVLSTFICAAVLESATAAPQAPASRSLTGTVLGSNGRPLEGITISARESQKTFTTSVFTDEHGNYSFPSLDKGQYKVSTQAVGFEAAHVEVSVEPGKEARQDFKVKTIGDFTMQLSGAEMVAALPSDTPGNRRMKEIFEHNCAACHTSSFVLQNRFDERGWQAILTAMERATSTGGWLKTPLPIIHRFDEELVAYLARVRGPGPSPMQFHPLPRPTGEAARVVITEFDIPPADTPTQLAVEDGSDWAEGTPSAYRNRGTHDVATDFYGNAWITSLDTGAPARNAATQKSTRRRVR